jgi:hypothetical protein
MAQERRRQEKLDQGQSYARTPENTDAPGRQSGQKGPRLQTAIISDEGKDISHKWHRSVEIRAAITSGKRRNAHEGPIGGG